MSWVWISELEQGSDAWVDELGRIWAYTYDGRDAIVGSHVAGRLPASQCYSYKLAEWQRRTHPRCCGACGQLWLPAEGHVCDLDDSPF